MNETPTERTERAPRDFRTEDEARLDTLLARLSDRDRRWLRELVKTEAGVKLLRDRI